MKHLTCQALGGACDLELHGETFEEIGKKSQEHVMEQLEKGDDGHKEAVERMKSLTPEQQQAEMEEYKKKFDEAQGE